MVSKYFATYGFKLISMFLVLSMTKDLFFDGVSNSSFHVVDNIENSSADVKRMLNDTKKLDLIINTYMRSGSTFLGKIFSIRPDAFYVFEPLWNAQKFAFYWGEKRLCHYSKNRCATQGNAAVTKGIGGSITLHESMSFLQSVLDCTLKDHTRFLPDARHFSKDFPNQKHSWTFSKGQLWKPYYECANSQKSNYKQCFSLMIPVCQNARHKVMKVLRTTLSNLEPLLIANKNLRVLHLFRDPRGILNSHMKTSFYQKKVKNLLDIENDIRTTCKRMKYDIKTALRLRRLYTDRFKIVQYEDFGDLFRSARILYNFMDMELTPEIEHNLEKIISSENSTQGFHPYSYRNSLPWNIERLANKHCHSVFLALGYPVYKDENEYKNMENVPKMFSYALG